MSVLHREQGASLRIEILQEPGIQSFIEAHTAALDHSMQSAQLSPIMKQRLSSSNYVFSGIKTFHELHEAFPSLLDEGGNRKPFEQFLNDVRSIDQTYNHNYLRAEYNFVNASADMAARWEQFQQDGDRYNLQYRTANDGKVRPEHAELHGVTLPPSDPFWSVYYPPNGWNCRCTVVQVRKSKYPTTDPTEAMERGERALIRDKKGMFRFNPGMTGKSFPDYNPYTISRCRDCDIASKLASGVFDNELCQACQLIRKCQDERCRQDDVFGKRLLISINADMSEIEDNTRAARCILESFPDVSMTIRKHIYVSGVKNPEYTINGLIADRKGIESENGVAAGFKKAIKQGCSAIVIDLDMHPDKITELKTNKLSSAINNRHYDFENDIIKECYVIFNGKAVRIDKFAFLNDPSKTRDNIKKVLEKIKSDRSHS